MRRSETADMNASGVLRFPKYSTSSLQKQGTIRRVGRDDNNWRRALRRPDIRHEAIELFAQTRAFARKGFGGTEHFLRGRPGFGGAAIDLHDVGGGLLRTLRDVLHAARDLLRRGALLLDGTGNRRGAARDLAHGAADLPRR